MSTRPGPRALARALVVAALVAVASVALPAAPASAAPAPPLPAPDSHGLTLDRWRPLDANEPTTVPRVLEATVRTDAIFEPGTGGTPTIDPIELPVKVRIYLPADYRTDTARPYPVLYLLHGGGDDAEAWTRTDKGDLKALIPQTPFPGIVVMPEGGKSGWYSDWYGETDGFFRPQWETFHIDQLVPWVDANFNTVANRSGRTLAGLSMGGLGTLMYGGRHRDVFSAIGSFSGGTDLTEPGAEAIIDRTMWVYGAAFSWNGLADGTYRVTGTVAERMTTVFGPTSGWGSKNPLAMADRYNSYDTRFGLYSGQNTSTREGERQIGIWNDELHRALNTSGVDHRYCTGTGTHSWSYWKADLVHFLRHTYGTGPAACPNGWGAPKP